MKFLFLSVLSLMLISCGNNFQTDEDVTQSLESAGLLTASNVDPGEETGESVLSYDEVLKVLEGVQEKAIPFRFSQTVWNECSEEITGNYSGYSCARSRGIAVIFKRFIDDYIHECIDAGLAAQGGGTVSELHIEHAGILGDRNHSPRSLHAENRAVDVKAFEMKLTSGVVKKFTYKYSSNQPFYQAFRKCWGETVRTYNGCPAYNGDISRTGSIGRENKYHTTHMHMSIPYCLRSGYGAYYYRR